MLSRERDDLHGSRSGKDVSSRKPLRANPGYAEHEEQRTDHGQVHLRPHPSAQPEPEYTAKYYERMFGAEIVRTMQQGKPRIDLKLGGANIFIALAAATASTRRRLRPIRASIISLTVSGIDAVVAELKAKGAEFTREPTTVRPGCASPPAAGPKACRSSCSTATSSLDKNGRRLKRRTRAWTTSSTR